MRWIVQLYSTQSYSFTVDRIEPPWAIVEWQNLELTHLPLNLFPVSSLAQEGAAYTVKIKRSRFGLPLYQQNPVILAHTDGLLAFPETISLVFSASPIVNRSPQGQNACSLLYSTMCYRLQIQADPQSQSQSQSITELVFN